METAHAHQQSSNISFPLVKSLLSTWEATDDVTVTRVGDGHDATAEVLTAGGSEVVVVARVVEDGGLGEESVVLNLGLPEGRAVVGDDDQLGLSLAEGLQSRLVPEGVLSGLDDQTELGPDGVALLLGRLGGHSACYLLAPLE